MTTPMPSPGSNGAGDHAAIGRRFVQHAREELEKGNLLQASEKVWGAAAHALKAVAIERGWRHGRHDLLIANAEQLAREYDRTDINILMSVANSFHVNFYENLYGEVSIRAGIDSIEHFVAALDEVRSSPPRPFTVESSADQNRLQRLLGRNVPIGTHSDVGFVQPRRRRSQP